MTETAEAVAIGLPTAGKDKCPICEKAPHPKRTTTDKKNKKGCLKSIPANLGCPPIPANPLVPNYATAAHHIIPANQCLKAFPRLSQMCETVGYDVNNRANGMSLPTCGQKTLNRYTRDDGKIVKYRDLGDSRTAVAFSIMAALKLQWHVGHHNWSLDGTGAVTNRDDSVAHIANYDKLVKLRLKRLEKYARQNGKDICEPKDESESGSALIGQLNALSSEIRGMVLSWTKYFVSALAYRFSQSR
jgi:hypothetical protein